MKKISLNDLKIILINYLYEKLTNNQTLSNEDLKLLEILYK